MVSKSKKRVLVVDVGGTHVKILVTGQSQKREMDSSPQLSAQQMVRRMRRFKNSVQRLSHGFAAFSTRIAGWSLSAPDRC